MTDVVVHSQVFSHWKVLWKSVEISLCGLQTFPWLESADFLCVLKQIYLILRNFHKYSNFHTNQFVLLRKKLQRLPITLAQLFLWQKKSTGKNLQKIKVDGYEPETRTVAPLYVLVLEIWKICIDITRQ